MKFSTDLHHVTSTAMSHHTPAHHEPRDTPNLHDVVNHSSSKGDHHWSSIFAAPMDERASLEIYSYIFFSQTCLGTYFIKKKAVKEFWMRLNRV